MESQPDKKFPSEVQINHRFFREVRHAHDQGLTRLNDWEQEFIRNNDGRPSYSESQQDAIDRMMTKHLPYMNGIKTLKGGSKPCRKRRR
jgi:hypothetical protein